jgi:lactate dehydrogenase-like 2-hydroxyacid dehydrogenase
MTQGLPPIVQVGQFPAAMQAEIDARLSTLRAPDSSAIAMITRSNTRIETDLLHALPNLRVIATCGVGVDNIPLAFCRSRSIAVSNTPGVLNDAVCELAIGLLLGLMRRLPTADRFVREGTWEQGPFPLTRSLAGKRVGIVGMGRIGQDLAARLVPFKVRLAYTGPRKKAVPYVFVPDVVALAGSSDVLILTCPGGDNTDQLIDRTVLAALGADGVLVNMSRGSVVNENDLIAALEGGVIAGAALDVFANEPHVPQRLRSLPNVVLSPHVGSATEETRVAMTRLAVDNLISFFQHGELISPVL